MTRARSLSSTSRPRSGPPTRDRPTRQHAAAEVDEPGPEQRIWQAVASIPRGRVATYGGIAALAGLPGRARMVGRVLSHLPTGTRLPWHRVLGASGRIAVRGGGEAEQLRRLRVEGVLTPTGRVDLRRYGWPADAIADAIAADDA